MNSRTRTESFQCSSDTTLLSVSEILLASGSGSYLRSLMPLNSSHDPREFTQGREALERKAGFFVTFDTQTSWQVTFLFIPLYNAERSAFRLPTFHSMAFQANISLQTLEFSEVELKSLTFHSPFLLAHLLSYAFPLITKKHICSLCHKHCKKH